MSPGYPFPTREDQACRRETTVNADLAVFEAAVAGVYVTLTVQFEPGALVEKQVVPVTTKSLLSEEKPESCSGTVPSPSASPAAECWGC